MANLTGAIQARLASDDTLAALIADYDDLPAIFTGDLIPEDAQLPYIWISGNVVSTEFEHKTQVGAGGLQTTRDIVIHTKHSESRSELEVIRDRVRYLLHRYALSVTGYTTVQLTVSGGVQLPLESIGERMSGVSLQLNIILTT